ncbi:MAG: class I SAM-dependent methyltransferase [Acidobacteriia bacterium]|nr:class I SAM-dependent methyltransferase [Terriglobia bacterium]
MSGIVLAPVIKALFDRKVFELFGNSSAWLELDRIVDRTHANRGYLRVALRLLASCGWLSQRIAEDGLSPRYALTPEGSLALRIAPPLYEEVLSFLPKVVFFEDFLFGRSDHPLLPSLEALVRRAQDRWGLGVEDEAGTAEIREQLRRHLDGILVGPAMVALARGGIFAQLGAGPVEIQNIHGNQGILSCVFDLLATQGWVVREQNMVRLTSSGEYAATLATSYGVTVSYVPLFNVVSILLFGNPRIQRVDESGVELLVNRGMNVWGSGGAHKTYFKKVDEIVVEIFNRPIARQPQGICDMGCGDGTFLEHLYSVVKTRTARGQVLDQHPLILVGADFNKVARRVAKQTLRNTNCPTFHVIQGDINRPPQLAADLDDLGLDIHDLLHVRSFLDHNRPYLPPMNYVKGTRQGRSTGAFARLGQEIAPDELEENLVRHLRRWAPYVGRFGLLLLELHTLPPELTAANLEKTPAVAYDGTHGFSDQYLVELPVFLECAREAGLRADPLHACKFPPSELATVSLNYFVASNSE